MTPPDSQAVETLTIAQSHTLAELALREPNVARWDFRFEATPSVRSRNAELALEAVEAVRLDAPWPRPRVFGCLLPEGRSLAGVGSRPAARPTPRTEDSAERPAKQRVATRGAQRTRIRPPRDVVKLEDRLQYLLQPPLESLLEAGSLRFPFHPFPYQLDGVAFLFPRRHAVLADEMGLGKTMQSITATRLLVHSGQARRVLLICPKPLVTNWQREFALWAPELPIATIGGARTGREWAWDRVAGPDAPAVTIVNYETMVRDARTVAEQPEPFDLVLLDEAQRIKNPRGATHQAVVSVPRERSWALTGTPIENSTDDLVGIFEFVSPGILRPGMSVRAVRDGASDTVLRRTKDIAGIDLPPKIDRDASIDLTPEQWDTYRRAEDDGVVQLNDLGAELTVQHVFELVLRLKQICNFDPATGESAKLERLSADLEECAASGRKAIVFSQWVDTIEKIAERLGRFNPEQYHGRIPHAQRDPVLKRFKEDPDCHVLLMSYGAGAVGLNLQFAGYVFLFDRWWNPAIEDQAINRAHRIGAAGSVTVTRMIATGTIEQRIDDILREKRELFDEVFSDAPGPGSSGLSRGELLSLFNLESPQGRIADAA